MSNDTLFICVSLTLVGYLTGYDGSFLFPNIGIGEDGLISALIILAALAVQVNC